MSLKEQITQDMKDAMRAKDSQRLGTIRLLMAAIKQKEVDERIEVTDNILVGIVDKLIKQRNDSITAYVQAQRQDLADKESAEILVLKAYLPARLNAQEIQAVIERVVQELQASGPADMGKVMARAKTELTGKADITTVSQTVKQVLSCT